MITKLSKRYRKLRKSERTSPLRVTDMYRFGNGQYYRTRQPGCLPARGLTYYRLR